MDKCFENDKKSNEYGKFGHLKKMCGRNNPTVAARFVKAARGKFRTVENQDDFNTVMLEVDDKLDQKIEAKKGKADAIANYKRMCPAVCLELIH